MKKGFTLIELLAVIVIIAIIGTIGIYSITKIINKNRLNSLTDTAFAVKKAASLYANENSDKSLPMTLEMKPGGEYAKLINLVKDPWGKDYESVLAVVNKINNKLEITVYLMTDYKDYYLMHNGSSLIELVYKPTVISSPEYSDLGNNFKIEYFLPKVYSVTSHEVNFVGGTSITTSDYTIINNSTNLNANGNYEIELNITKPGSYQMAVEITDGTQTALSYHFNIDVYSKILPSTLYFRGDGGLASINTNDVYSLQHNSNTSYTAYFSIRISRKTTSGEFLISDWQQAQVTAPYRTGEIFNGIRAEKVAVYNFPGWSDGNTTDQLIVDVGLSSANTGTPNFGTRRFITDILNTKQLLSHTFTVYYYVNNDYPWDSYNRIFWYGYDTFPSRIVTTPIN